jgi:hypothetical protein
LGQAPAPMSVYSSAFADYRPYEDLELANWRAVNDTVREAAAKSSAHGNHGPAAQTTAQEQEGSRKSPPAPRVHGPRSMGHGHHRSVHGGKP